MMFKQKGIGLLELMLSLAIIAVILVMATRYFQSTSQNQKVNQATSDVQAILAAFTNFRAGNPSGECDIDDLQGFLPRSWAGETEGGGAATNVGAKANPWGSAYTASCDSGNPNNIEIAVENMAPGSCEALKALIAINTTDGGTCDGDNYSGTFAPGGAAETGGGGAAGG